MIMNGLCVPCNRRVLRRSITLAGMCLVLVGMFCLPAFAQGGCVQASPENSSLILGLLGAAVGALAFIRARRKTRKARRDARLWTRN